MRRHFFHSNATVGIFPRLVTLHISSLDRFKEVLHQFKESVKEIRWFTTTTLCADIRLDTDLCVILNLPDVASEEEWDSIFEEVQNCLSSDLSVQPEEREIIEAR